MEICSFKKFEIKVLKLYRILLSLDLYKRMSYFMITPETFPKCNSVIKRHIVLLSATGNADRFIL